MPIRPRNLSLAVLGCIATTAAFFMQPTPQADLSPLRVPPATATRATSVFVPRYEDATPDWVMTPSHQQISGELSTITESLGGGVCVLDANNDGWQDVFFIGGSGQTRDYGRSAWWLNPTGNRLLINRSGLRFEDGTEQAGLAERMHGMGCAAADLDNDGDTDLLVTGVGGSRLFSNDGNGTFTDVTGESGLLPAHWSTGATVADIDGDGLLDIYISNYVLYRKGARAFEERSGFMETRNVAFRASLFDPEPNQLYINRGNLRFSEQAEARGVANGQGRSLGARLDDIDGDSHPDLLVINEHSSSNKLFINNGDGHFTPAGPEYAPFEMDGAHDLQIGDFDGDALPEYFFARGSDNPAVLLEAREGAASGEVRYRDAARARGLADARQLPFASWGAIAEDLNLDGWLDLVTVNGGIAPDIDSHFVALGQPNSLAINRGDGTFSYSALLQDRLHPYASRGVASVDLDNDGVLELLVANNNNPLQVLRRVAAHGHWLGVDASGVPAGLLQNGRVEVLHNGRWQKRPLSPRQGFLSQSDARLVFGLGDPGQVDSLRIVWGDGSHSELSQPATDRYYRVAPGQSPLALQQRPPARLRLDLTPLPQPARDELIALLLADPERNLAALDAVWRAGDADTRLSLLRQLGDTPPKPLLNIAMRGLLSNHSGVLLAAIQTIRHAELESSVARLIPLLRHPDQDVQCATADTFRFFFDEEEAVPHRKTLAVSPLIELLQQGDERTAACAADALGAAERQRAVLPLMQQLATRRQIDTRAALIRALGLVRDIRALPLLHDLLQTPSTSATEAATILIALQRLNDPQLVQQMQAYLERHHEQPQTVYRTLAAAYRDRDGIVLRRNQLQVLFDAANETAPSRDVATRLARLEAIAAGRLQQYLPEVEQAARDGDAAIRDRAVLTLAQLGSPTARHAFEKHLLSMPMDSAIAILRTDAIGGFGYSREFVQTFAAQLLAQLDDTPASFQRLLSVITHISDTSSAHMLQQLLPGIPHTPRLVAMLNICSDRQLQIDDADEVLLLHPDAQVRTHYVDCLFNRPQPPDLLQAFARRFILRDMVSDRDLQESTKLHLLTRLAQQDPVIAGNLLQQRLPQLPDEWRLAAIDALWNSRLSPETRDYLWELLRRDPHPATRIKAARLLAAAHSDGVTSHLLGELSIQ